MSKSEGMTILRLAPAWSGLRLRYPIVRVEGALTVVLSTDKVTCEEEP
jgi:hypothetical protein